VVVSKGDFIRQVSVSGTVTPARDVDLGFASNGRISGVYAQVGQHVSRGMVLAETENNDLVAAVSEKQAALQQVQAELASLLSGSTNAQIAVASTTIANAEAALTDAVQSAYTTADDAVHNRVDSFFTNPRTIPELTFSVTSASSRLAVESDRKALVPVFAAWAQSLAQLSPDTLSAQAASARKRLAQVAAFLADVNSALNLSVPDQKTSAATLSTYATTLSVARTNVNGALASLTSAMNSLSSAEKNLALVVSGPTPDAIAAQKAAVAAAEAGVASARAALAKTQVTAPFSGTVTRMDAKIGEIVSPNTSLIAMQSDGFFQIDTYVPEVSIADVAVGNAGTTTLDAYGSSVTFPVKVVSVDPAETEKGGVPTYKTVLSFLSQDPRIRSGMTANVLITTGVLPNTVVIPAGAIGRDAQGAYVSVVENGKVERRSVELGVTPSLGQVEVRSGLSGGETILLTPQG
jgi:multidrug efflux pump subunit AcrA (membrane-fusion protein)